jgi:hypothetical protein
MSVQQKGKIDLADSASPAPVRLSEVRAASVASARIGRTEDVALFPTQVKIVHWQTEPGFNERLSAVCMELFESRIRGKLQSIQYNLWDDPSAELLELRRMFELAMGNYIDDFLRPQTKNTCTFEMRAWLRIDRPKEVKAPHTHGDSNVVATYYPQVDVADHRASDTARDRLMEGSLLLLDPRSGVLFRAEKSEPTYAITPQAGMMVIIPGYLCHWTNPVSDGDRRICIANNMTLVPKNRRVVSGQFPQD